MIFFASDINYSYMCWHNYLLKNRKENIVIDNMNLKQFQRDRTKFFQERGYKITFVFFFEPPKNEIEYNKWSNRLLSRPNKEIPFEELMKMQQDYCQTVSPSAIVQPDEVIRINNWSE